MDILKNLFVLLFALCAFAAVDYHTYLPDSTLTPGAVADTSSKAVLKVGYSKENRKVSEATKREVYRRYGIKHHARGEYEIDHLIPLELGGSNDIKNLWPQSYHAEPWNAHKKDRLENRLKRLVLTKHLTLQEAQEAICRDWIAAYVEYVEKPVREAQEKYGTKK